MSWSGARGAKGAPVAAMRTIVAKYFAPFTKRWVCEDCKAQVKGVTLGTLEVFGPCLCDGWSDKDNPYLAQEVARLVADGAKELRP